MRTFERVRTLSLMLAFAAGVIPFVTYITDANSGLLWPMMAANIFAYVMIALTTIRITLDVANREKAKLAVPAKYADDPVRSKWYTAVKFSQKWHLLAVLPRFALAYALMQLLHKTINFAWMCAVPYCYTSHYGFGDAPLIYPQIETVLISGTLLALFALAEVRLLCAAGMMVERSRRYFWNAVDIIGLRAILILVILLSLHPLSDGFVKLRRFVLLGCNTPGYIADGSWQRDIAALRVLDTGYLTLYSLLDNGTGMAVNIVRPVGQDSLFATTYQNDAATGIQSTGIENRPFVARQVVAGLLGLLLYVLLTRGCLWLATKQHAGNLPEAG